MNDDQYAELVGMQLAHEIYIGSILEMLFRSGKVSQGEVSELSEQVQQAIDDVGASFSGQPTLYASLNKTSERIRKSINQMSPSADKAGLRN